MDGLVSLAKRVDKEGEGWGSPSYGDEVEVHLNATCLHTSGSLIDGALYLSSREIGYPLKFILGRDIHTRGLNLGITSMKKGEIAVFTIPPNLAYGEHGRPPHVCPNATIMFHVELISWLSLHKHGLLGTFRNLEPVNFLYTTDAFSSLCGQDGGFYNSDIFESGGFKWRLCLYPNGNRRRNIKHDVSLYLQMVETQEFCTNWEVFATFSFFIYDQIRDRYLTLQDGSVRRFHRLKTEWGIDKLISLADFTNADNGFLDNDRCSFGAEVRIIKQNCQIFEELSAATKPAFSWKIENLSRLGTVIRSEPVTMGGYNWCVAVYPTGHGAGTDKVMAIYLVLLDTERLANLNLELQLECVIRLCDQHKTSHFERRSTWSYNAQNSHLGYARFIELGELHDEVLGYKKDDAMIIEVQFISFSVRGRLPLQSNL